MFEQYHGVKKSFVPYVTTCYNTLMSAVKLQKIGNSFGFRVPKQDLEFAGFDEDCDYELIAEKGVILLVKKRIHHSRWIFKDTSLSVEDQRWLEAKMHDGDDE